MTIVVVDEAGMMKMTIVVVDEAGVMKMTIVVVDEAGMMKSTRGTKQCRVFTTSLEVCAGSNTTARSLSTTILSASAANSSSLRSITALLISYHQLLSLRLSAASVLSAAADHLAGKAADL